MEKFIITGGIPIKGEMTPSGNKNAALPLLAACLLTTEPVILHNVPDILDVRAMIRLLQSLNVKVEMISTTSVRLDASEIRPADLNPEMCRKIRASILLAGPMLSRVGDINLPPPGGDVIGRRRVDTHILAFSHLGVKTQYYDNQFHFKANELVGANILLDEASVTATENAIMACVLAKGKSVLRNAASEPHIQELCHFLNSLGANIENVGSNTLQINGVDKLKGGEFSIGPDYLEVVSYMIHLVMNRLGVSWETSEDDIIVPNNQALTIEPDLGNAIPEISVMPWPSFPTDLMSIAIVIATQSKGSILFHDWMYPSRMYFTDKLVGMGAQIVLPCTGIDRRVFHPHTLIEFALIPMDGDNPNRPDTR